MSDVAATTMTEWRPRANPWLIAVPVMLATFMGVLDTSIVVVALPYIAGNLGATQDESTCACSSLNGPSSSAPWRWPSEEAR